MASQSPHFSKTPPLPHITRPQLLSETVEQNFMTSLTLKLSCLQNQDAQEKGTKFSASSKWNHSCIGFYVLAPEKHSPRWLLLGGNKPPSSCILSSGFLPLLGSLCLLTQSRFPAREWWYPWGTSDLNQHIQDGPPQAFPESIPQVILGSAQSITNTNQCVLEF